MGSKAQVEWLTLHKRRQRVATGGQKLKAGRGEGWSGIRKLLSEGFHFSVTRQGHLRIEWRGV